MSDDVNLEKHSDQEKKKDKKVAKVTKLKKRFWVWPLKVFVLSVALSIVFGIASEYFMSATGIFLSSLIVLLLIIISITADIIGISVAASTLEPFNSMSARKIKGAKEAILLIKNADKVSVICNDVIGDICGIISGAAGASIVGRITSGMLNVNLIILITALTSALIAGFTISGKSFGKNYAINNSDKIVLFIGKMLSPLWKEKSDKK